MEKKPGIFDPVTINGIRFRSRILRSSLGGRMAYYDGKLSPQDAVKQTASDIKSKLMR